MPRVLLRQMAAPAESRTEPGSARTCGPQLTAPVPPGSGMPVVPGGTGGLPPPPPSVLSALFPPSGSCPAQASRSDLPLGLPHLLAVGVAFSFYRYPATTLRLWAGTCIPTSAVSWSVCPMFRRGCRSSLWGGFRARNVAPPEPEATTGLRLGLSNGKSHEGLRAALIN